MGMMFPQTPFYYYDTALLQSTLDAIHKEIEQYPNYHVHYALKANANPKLLHIIQQAGLGADCVSGGEVQAAIDAGFPAEKVVYAGVGKSDREILTALQHNIFCFNAAVRHIWRRSIGSEKKEWTCLSAITRGIMIRMASRLSFWQAARMIL